MSGEEIAYVEAVRLIEQQEATLAGVHTRAAVLVSAASVATAFFAKITDTGKGLSGRQVLLVIVAGCLFVAVDVLALLILLPRQWKFGRSGLQILRNYVFTQPDGAVFTDDEIRRDLTLHLEQNHTDNDVQLRRMFVMLAWGIGALGLEVLAWLTSTVR